LFDGQTTQHAHLHAACSDMMRCLVLASLAKRSPSNDIKVELRTVAHTRKWYHLAIPASSMAHSTSVATHFSSAVAQPQAEQSVYRAIHKQLTSAFDPITHLEIINESHKHNV
jgi:hypothetical protein